MPNQSCRNYMYECWHCGCPVVSTSSRPILRVFCQECRDKHDEIFEEKKQEYIKLKTEMMYERSLRYLEAQECCLAHYKDAADAVYDLASKNPEKFQSAPEMMAAMELIRNHVKIKMQYKINRHTIDILIPSMKVGLEIDGYNHKFKVLKDSQRDVALVNELGPGWEIIRIPTKYIEANVKQLIHAIKELYSEKQRLRSKHNGFVPTYFSDRDKALQKEFEEQAKPFKVKKKEKSPYR